MNLSNLKISTRLIILISAFSVLLVVIGGVGLLGIGKTDGALKRVYEDRMTPMGQIAEIQRLFLRSRLLISNALLNPTPKVIAQNTTELDANRSDIGKICDAFMLTNLTLGEARIAQSELNQTIAANGRDAIAQVLIAQFLLQGNMSRVVTDARQSSDCGSATFIL